MRKRAALTSAHASEPYGERHPRPELLDTLLGPFRHFGLLATVEGPEVEDEGVTDWEGAR